MAKRVRGIVVCRELGFAEFDIEASFGNRSRNRLSLNRNDTIGTRIMERVRVFEIEKGIDFGSEEQVGGFDIRILHEARVGENPRPGIRRLVVIGRDHEEIGERSGRFDDRVGRVEERLHRDALVAARERVGRVDVGVARDAEGRSVGLARDGRRSLLADLAHPHALVPRVELGVAGQTEENRVDSAEKRCRAGLARVAKLGCHAPSFQATRCCFDSHIETKLKIKTVCLLCVLCSLSLSLCAFYVFEL